MTHATEALTGAALLEEIYGRLVGWHHIIAAAAAKVPPESQARMMREMMATLEEIGRDPTFRAASEERRRAIATPRVPIDEARIARLRARAAAGLDAG